MMIKLHVAEPQTPHKPSSAFSPSLPPSLPALGTMIESILTATQTLLITAGSVGAALESKNLQLHCHSDGE